MTFADLFVLDPWTTTWTQLDLVRNGTSEPVPPPARYSHGLAYLEGKLYVFGGYHSGSFEYGECNPRRLTADSHE